MHGVDRLHSENGVLAEHAVESIGVILGLPNGVIDNNRCDEHGRNQRDDSNGSQPLSDENG